MLTDISGSAVFTIVGGATNGGGGVAAVHPGSGFIAARVYADGWLLGFLTVAAYDENGTGGVDGADLAGALGDSFNPGSGSSAAARTDFDCDGAVTVDDLAVLLGVSFTPYSKSASPYAW